MDWINPVEWLAWLYGKAFQNHAYIGGIVVVAAFAVIGLVLWIRGVDKYKEEHQRPPDSHAEEAKPSSASRRKPDNPASPSPGGRSERPKITVEQHSTGPDSPNVAMFGNNSPVTITRKPNPHIATVWYDFNGAKHIQQGTSGEVVIGEEYTIFPRLEQLQTGQKWQELIELCEQQMTRSPEWLTPYVFAGVGYANLGQKDTAIKRLEYVAQHAEGNKDYEDAARILRILKEPTQQ